MIYQTDSEFEPDIQHFGCYFLSLLYQLNRLLGTPEFDHKIIEVIYNTCQHTDANNNGVTDMNPECFIADPQGVVDYIVPGKVKFLYKQTADYVCQSEEFEVQTWYNPATQFTHFVAGLAGAVIYDPIQGGSRTVREGHIDSKRIFKML